MTGEESSLISEECGDWIRSRSRSFRIRSIRSECGSLSHICQKWKIWFAAKGGGLRHSADLQIQRPDFGQIPLPKGEGGPKGRVRGEGRNFSSLTRRFASPSPFGRGICPKPVPTFFKHF